MKRAVGTKPALLGTKLTHDWVVTDRFLDCSVDVASSSMATVLVGMLQQYAKYVLPRPRARMRQRLTNAIGIACFATTQVPGD